MADSGAKPQSIGVPGPTVDPEVETLNFHLYCRDFVMLNPPDWEASISYPEPQSNSRPGSPQSSRPVSPDPGGPVRRADAPPPVFLMGCCKMPSGRDRLVSLNLNKCLGWDDDRKVFTSEYDAHGIARGHCWDCGYKEYFSLTSIFSIGCKCSTNTRDRTRWEVKEFTQPGVIVYDESTGHMGCHGYFGSLLGPWTDD
ncbi:hypothetical protein BDV40DRAFT_295597 [Aspergillus tamarii]|uniref:Cyanovirin-N domain-containing protein n=1 Tax=Aspergillus tamarii TaxID=41984 RepID=A0A5N6VC78_ASPTM|nr:hypothetical protein BDV40DRAFT_295597 [Aspergillus tamarii]